MFVFLFVFFFFFFFNDTATTEIYTLSLHDALPISLDLAQESSRVLPSKDGAGGLTPMGADDGHDVLAKRIAALETLASAQDRTIRKLLKMAAAFLDSDKS